ncbi:hypothetical protein E2542_SST12700 [Spatholobus suberectus]|nr:hypothetical protein E2542_SST12700 [Spatholobus suberectus]
MCDKKTVRHRVSSVSFELQMNAKLRGSKKAPPHRTCFDIYTDIMEKKTLFSLLVILLGLSCVVFAAAVPATRSSMIGKMDPLVQDHLAKEDQVMGLRNSEELLDMKEGIIESRMMVDITDYPGTKANPAHDPKSPGKP